MIGYIPHFLILPVLIVLICSCTEKANQQESKLPEHLSNLENLTVYSADTQAADTVLLTKETVFESGKDVFIDGYIGELAIDDEDRVYITGTMPGTVGIYVFEPNGRFITKFGQEGRGPGEFESIGSLSIRGNKIYVFGPRLQKFGVFSLDDYQLIRDQIIRRDSIPKNDELARILRVNEIHVTESGEILAKMSNLSIQKENEITKVLYHKISADGFILPDRILELDKFQFYFGKNEPYPLLMPFSRNSLISISDDGSFYTAWSEDFWIKKYNKDGKPIKSHQLRFNNAPLSISKLDLSNTRERILSAYDIPDTWQALYTLETDDENRIWVSTITESDSTFSWWVLHDKGELLATFAMPGKRSNISVMTKPLYKIKNGYFYTREQDVRAGIDRIVKYKVEFKAKGNNQ